MQMYFTVHFYFDFSEPEVITFALMLNRHFKMWLIFDRLFCENWFLDV